MVFDTVSALIGQVQSGALRALAVTGKTRAPTLPDTPTMAEAGYPEVEGATWTAVVVPKGTPKHIVEQFKELPASNIAVPEKKSGRTSPTGRKPSGDAIVRARFLSAS